MTDIVDLAARRAAAQAAAEEAATGPHWAGSCVCLGCRHEWVGVGPIPASNWLECPACGLPKGTVKHPFGAAVGDTLLTCSTCNCEALTVYRRAVDGLKVIKCIGCGIDLTDAVFDG